MESSTTTEECPVCRGTVQNPSEPSPCCNKVFCQSCLTQSTRIRYHCPHCRTPLPGRGASRPVRTALFRRLPGLDSHGAFSTAQPVSSNIHALLSQLRDAQALQTSSSSAGSPASQASPAPAAQAAFPFASPIQRRPTPRPHLRHPARVVTVAPSSPLAPNPFAVAAPHAPVVPLSVPSFSPANSAPLIMPDSSSEEFDGMAWRTEIALMENSSGQPSGPIVRTFKCPYCQEDGLDDLDLRDHCNANHLNDTRQVVCPICVSLPHGDPLYHSRSFIGHLNLRHCYYIQDITNVHQSDDVNLQAAILMSLSKTN
ncbi:uncharacterized protein rnf125 [Salminus brasiliensis]|uniref:uncharacterized protein rnf125 n=1 Tax=Salminus brasiliensis TaxID=930266 RepID=UPI003B835861